MVTHSSTSRPVQCLCMAERTGCPVLTDLWSYVSVCVFSQFVKLDAVGKRGEQNFRSRGDTVQVALLEHQRTPTKLDFHSTVAREHDIL
jgi:hypothetical protein